MSVEGRRLIRRATGWVLISSPFVGCAVVGISTAGLAATAGIFGFVAVVVLIIGAGTHLISAD